MSRQDSGADAWLADVLPGFTLTRIEPTTVEVDAGESRYCDICGSELLVTYTPGEEYGMSGRREVHGYEVMSVEDPTDSNEVPERLDEALIGECCADDLRELIPGEVAA